MKMARPTVIVTEPRRRGRRSISTTDTPPADVRLLLAPEDYDRAHAIALRRGESVQAVIRRGLKRLLEDERGGPLGV